MEKIENPRKDSIDSILRSMIGSDLTQDTMSEEEKIKNLFIDAGYNMQQVSVFFHYRNKTLPSEYLQVYKILIGNMLIFYNKLTIVLDEKVTLMQ